MRTLRRLACGVAICLMICGTAACSSDPLSISCQEYLGKSNSEQLDLAAMWAAPNRQHVDATAKFVAPKYREDLLNYCPSHPKDRLKDLELRLGWG